MPPLAWLHQGCSWGKPHRLPLQPEKGSETSSVSEDCFPAEVWRFLSSWGLQNCCLLAICSPEAVENDSFCPSFCRVGLWETWVSRRGSLPIPKDCKVACRVPYASTQALIPWQCIFCTSFKQMLLPNHSLKSAQTHCFPLLLICGAVSNSCAATDTASYNLTLKDSRY